MIKTHTFPSGLRVVMEEIPSVRSVSIGIWIGTGSKYETLHNNGISHFLEHMLFKGTEKRSARDIAEAFDCMGGHLNAFTSKEYTCYYAKILDEHLSQAFDILSDMFFHSTFDEGELEKEKNVVLEELHMYDDTPDDLIHDLIAEATYKDHSLGYNILGRTEVLQQLKGEHLRQYMGCHYSADNVVIAIAGNIHEQEVLDLTSYYFQEFDSVSSPYEPLAVEPRVTSEHLIRHKETEQSHLCIGLKGLNNRDEKLYPLIILNNVLGGSMSSRLFQNVREEKGLAYSVFSYHTGFQEAGSFHIYAGTSTQHVHDVYASCMNILEDLVQNGITEKELHNSKEQLKGNLVLSLESTNSRMSHIGRNELLLRKHLTLDEMITKIENIQLTDIHQLAQCIFTQPHSFALVSSLDCIPDIIRADRLIS